MKKPDLTILVSSDLFRFTMFVAVLLLLGCGIWLGADVLSENARLKRENAALQIAKDTFIAEHTSGINTAFVAQLRAEDVHVLVNAARRHAGLPELAYDPRLEQTACTKADDMVARDYWAHTDPDGQSPWHIFTDQQVYYREAGENLGYGFKTGDELVKGWMGSPGHRANILKESFTAEGLCFRAASMYQGHQNQMVVVQHFMKEL